MKRIITFLLSFIILPCVAMAANTVKIQRTGNSYTSGELMAALKDDDVIELTDDLDSFTFNNNESSNLTIDLKGHNISSMTLQGAHRKTTGLTSIWNSIGGNTSWTVTDSGDASSNKGSINKLIIGGENKNQSGHTTQTNTANINGIVFTKDAKITIQKDKNYEEVDVTLNECSYTKNDVVNSVPIFISNSANLTIQSGEYNIFRLDNNDTLTINGGTFNGVIIDSDIVNTTNLIINGGTFSNINNDSVGNNYLIKNYNSAIIKGGTYTLDGDYFIYNTSGTVELDNNTTSRVTVNSNSNLFYNYGGNVNIYNGTYKTTTEGQAFNFYQGTVTFKKGTIEAKNSSGGVFYNLVYGNGTPTDTNPLIDLRNGEVTVSNSFAFNSGIMYVKRKTTGLSINPTAPSGYKVIYEPTDNAYYTAKLVTSDTEDPGYLPGDEPTFAKGDWDEKDGFDIKDISYYRKYLAGNEESINNKLYADFDTAKKEALNYDNNTEITIIDLVQARIALAG